MFGSKTTKVFVIFMFMFMVAFSHAHVFDITKFGAKHGGEISKALSEAWKCACNTPKHSKLIIPKGQFCLDSFEFKGPCKGTVEIRIDAVIIGPKDPKVIPKGKQWITFSYITGMTLTGVGTLDGLGGAMAWPSNNPKKTAHKKTACGLQYVCVFIEHIYTVRINKNLKKLNDPDIFVNIAIALNTGSLFKNLSFNFIQNSLITGITSKDSKNFHVNVMSCTHVVFDNFNILAPAESPNTDGIHLGWSKHITIKNSIIRTGDDCISIGDGCENLHIEGVKCGPGHGISVGSLGRNPGEKPVKGVFVKNCVFSGTANGVRIKTWPDSLPGEVADMHFEDLTMDRVEVPIIIEQDYCPHGACSKSKPSLVKVHKVVIRNIKGTATTPTVVKLRCSTANHGCENVKISDINLRYDGPHGPARQECCNVRPIYGGKMIPPPCTRF